MPAGHRGVLGRAILEAGTRHGQLGLAAPTTGGSVLAWFDDVPAAAAPELAGHLTDTSFDADIGRLDVVPDSPASATDEYLMGLGAAVVHRSLSGHVCVGGRQGSVDDQPGALAEPLVWSASSGPRWSYGRARALLDQHSALAGPGAGWDLHEYRHSSLTHLGEHGASELMLMAKSRHKKVENVRRYFKSSAEAIADVTSLLAPGGARR